MWPHKQFVTVPKQFALKAMPKMQILLNDNTKYYFAPKAANATIFNQNNK